MNWNKIRAALFCSSFFDRMKPLRKMFYLKIDYSTIETVTKGEVMAKKSGNMNVAVTINDTYFYPLYVMLHTLYSVHPDVCITVFLIHSRVSRENIQKLQEVCQKYGGRLQEIFVESSMFSDAPAYLYFTKEMYYRILCAGLLPESVDRVLYLDPDLIVMDCLKEVYDMSMDDCLFAGCADRNVDKYKKEYKRALGMNPDSTYFNSGVLLCNLKKLRCEQQADDVFAMLRERGSRLLFPDQDIINVLYEGKIARLDDPLQPESEPALCI